MLFDIINYIVFIAAYTGQKEVVKELLNHNSDIEAKNRHGNTPLILGIFVDYYVIWYYYFVLFQAAYEGHIEVVKELINHNAVIEAKDNHGNTPLILGNLLDYSVFWYY